MSRTWRSSIRRRAPERSSNYSPDLIATLIPSAAGSLNFNPFGRTIWDKQIAEDSVAPLYADPPPSQRNVGSYGPVADYPPLYYLTLAPAYSATHALGGSTLAAVTVMRGVSALYAGVTMLALFAMLSELFPRRRRLVIAVAVICAYQPVFVWISGGINPDGALIALGTTMFWLFARAFRRGSPPARRCAGIGHGGRTAVQIRGLGSCPAGRSGGWCCCGYERPGMRAAQRLGGRAPGAIPLVLYDVVNVLIWDRPLIPGGVSAASSLGRAGRSESPASRRSCGSTPSRSWAG